MWNIACLVTRVCSESKTIKTVTKGVEKMTNTVNKLEYYYENEAEQFVYYRVPKILVKDKRFSKISSDAKLLYSLLLDRMSLSRKNGWVCCLLLRT